MEKIGLLFLIQAIFRFLRPPRTRNAVGAEILQIVLSQKADFRQYGRGRSQDEDENVPGKD